MVKTAGQELDQEQPASSPDRPVTSPPKGGLPAYRGPQKPKLVVVGERFERETAPFTGPAGQFFVKSMLEASIKPDKSGFAWVLPSLVELLEELRPQWIVLTGDKALQAIRPDLEQRYCYGRPFALPGHPFGQGPVCFPVLHHVAVKRNKLWHDLQTQQLALLRRMATDPNGWVGYIPDDCVKCRGEFHRIDDQGVVYCEQHWDLRGAGPRDLLVAAFNPDSGEPAIWSTSSDPH